jgi:hypothetical protein
MKKLITLLIVTFSLALVKAQNYPLVSVSQINTPIDLANCNDTSALLGDTVRIRVHVVTDGGLSEVASGSVQGGNRPFIYVVDTSANGAATPDQGIEIMGVYRDASNNLQPIPGFTGLFQGDKIEVTGIVEQFDGSNQFTTLDANSLTLLASGDLMPSAFTSAVVPVGDLNDAQRVNNVQQGEQWQNSFVELQNVTVVQVTPFSGNRVSFDVQDANGNLINVSDRFLAQRTPSHQVVNPNSPSTSGTGSFVPPNVGTFYTSLSGIIRHSANGCTGGTGRGYEINPFDTSHYQVGASAPNITNVISIPLQPTSNDPVTVQATITDADGSIASANIYYSTNPSVASANFTQAPMSFTGNDNYEFVIPAQSDGTLVRYYIEATDNDNSTVLFPVSPASATNPNFNHYAVRDNGLKIFDIQYSGNGTGESALDGQTVTVRGFVTAARRDCDLEYVYIQDPSDSLYSGIALIPNQDLGDLYRDQQVEVTGTVQETFGVTYLNVTGVTGLTQSQTIMPTPVNPSDTTLNMEAYEGMLISYENTTATTVPVEVSDPDLGFGEYAVALSGSTEEKRVLAGRQDGTRATSSLYVSLVSDTSYNTQNGAMQVPPVAAQQGMTMTAIQGVLWFSFGNYKLLPRNNFDIINLSVALDTTNCNVPTNVGLANAKLNEVSIYPNPAKDILTINSPGTQKTEARLYNLNGSQVKTYRKAGQGTLNVSDLPAGVYLLKLENSSLNTTRTYKVVITQ